ncbi:PfkB family carbohydrate kinase [Pseudovibrio exalbescens]|uniref:PfkB family carbohydrate kinase n=1 Tax=Pseudovibrio exalbescens TaxID=197461 RepID=UPI000C9D05CB|nr:PfkB family carbohydrate kinase [Pseudovibrio exalbescens]
MEALFIGQSYIDITFLCDELPHGDQKTRAEDYAVSFGGNAVTAAFTCAKLGIKSDLLCTMADDWLAHMFRDMANRYPIRLHGRKVKESSLSFIMPNDGHRAVVRCRDNDFIHPFPQLRLDGCRALHIDGHMPDAALHYARQARGAGMLTSFDGGAYRCDTDEILQYIDVAVVSELFCDQMQLGYLETLNYLRSKGVKVGGVTLGPYGMLWYEHSNAPQHMPALAVSPDQTRDSNGAGDIFHGAYLYSYLKHPKRSWLEHFQFARAASAHSLHFLGNEASLPRLTDIEDAANCLPLSTLRPAGALHPT